MISLLALLQKSYATGWLVAAPIGPVNLEIIRRGLSHRLLSGFLIGLGACCVDASYLSIFSLGLGAILKVPAVQSGAFVVGGVFLSWIALGAFGDARGHWRHRNEPSPGDTSGGQRGVADRIPAGAGGKPARGESSLQRFAKSPLGSFFVGIGMTATNPMTIAFWSALALEFMNLPVGYRLAATGGLLAGTLSWVLVLTGLLAWARRWVGPRLFAFVTLAGGSVVLYFGLRFLWRGLAIERWIVSWFY